MLEFSPAMTDGGFPSSSPRPSTSRSQAQSKLPAIFWQQTIIHCAREMKVTTRRTTSWLIYRASNNRARQSAFAETDDDELRSLFSCFVGLSTQRCWNDILLIPFLADFTHRFFGMISQESRTVNGLFTTSQTYLWVSVVGVGVREIFLRSLPGSVELESKFTKLFWGNAIF